MFRPSLADLPELVLPPGASIRHMRAGEDALWENIIRAAFNRVDMTFDGWMRKDAACTPERVLFLEADGMAVATASAWKREAYGPDCGYLHWVGALPGYGGRGFGYAVTLAALYRMREEGCISAVLHTNDERLPAIRTYLKLGFHICMDHPSLPRRWQSIMRSLGL